MQLGLRNKTAFVAGSSAGIGLAIAAGFLHEGANVVITGRDTSRLNAARTELQNAYPESRLLAVQGDMTVAEEIASALNTVGDEFDGLDVLVANVGSGKATTGWQIEPSEWQHVLRQNFLGSIALVTAGMPRLLRTKGNVVFTSSITGCEALGAPLTYSAAKAALQCTMKCLAAEVGPQGVRVNAVAPGNVLFPGGRWEEKLAEKKESFEAYIRDNVPLQRFGRTDEIADAVLFLASERASFITGTCLIVDGGQTRGF